MALGPRIGPQLSLRQSQTLVMTPQLRQAIKLLQYSNLELADFVQEELDRNPLLEREEAAEPGEEALSERVAPNDDLVAAVGAFQADGGAEPIAEAVADRIEEAAGAVSSRADWTESRVSDGQWEASDRAESPWSLREHLAQQLRLGFSDDTDRLIGAQLIGALDGAGRMTVTPAEVADGLVVPLARVEAVRERMMGFDPVGLFALDLRECLRAQLIDRRRLDPAMACLVDNLDLLARRDHARLATLCHVTQGALAVMITELKSLDPKPGAREEGTPLQPLIPDVLLRPVAEGGWYIELNRETLPRVLVNYDLHAHVLGRAGPEDRAFLSERLQNANWLVKSLHQRAQTILKVTAEVVRRQDGFLRHGASHLRPLTLREIADAISMHESTVSRVTANKSIATPRGVFELKFLFTNAIAGTDGEIFSAEAIRHRIRALIGAESQADILSDDAIVAILRQEGVDIARRTVAKYREALRIPASLQRKRDKTAA
ncbi:MULTISPECIES: RNA polymerase factor sigma-54 [unclassified Acidisoma]|jgi:RNA polymerase sigma-54 factor|uniref:RNA polymerase factor sigma-54 n=1 Tax=unclassified Acidisoma TaxID=2634065 RepID=UPI00131B2FBE|nr:MULTISPECIES: RNA polymerase factor sigma-54 [unclassified Acidisoma]